VRYRYYVSQALLQNKLGNGSIGRVPPAEIEALVITALRDPRDTRMGRGPASQLLSRVSKSAPHAAASTFGVALKSGRLRKFASGCGTSDHLRSLFSRGGEEHDMHRLVLFALAIPLACLALLCWVAFMGVVMIAVGMYLVGTIKRLEGPRSRALPS
jgi:hypothetical protein